MKPTPPTTIPLGLDGFEFVEFTGPDPEALAGLFSRMGFTHLGNHKSKNVRHYAQGDINFILNMEPSGQAADFRDAHGPSANAHGVPGEGREAGAAPWRSSAARSGRDRARPRGARHPGDRGDRRRLSLSRRPLRQPSRSTTIDFEPVPGAAPDGTASACTRSTISPTM